MVCKKVLILPDNRYVSAYKKALIVSDGKVLESFVSELETSDASSNQLNQLNEEE